MEALLTADFIELSPVTGLADQERDPAPNRA
jgi:hypothetical protein